ncbi:hypothetical protein Tco_1045616 [Tanacetum coccineum]|uniref:Uncharacterized protein n=1 Tax=Tanacetum coccineum TaxID=301880 RepID=A0ABQ5GTB6_9ASTR
MIGARKDAIDGLKALEVGDTMKLRANRILNASGLSGRMIGNRASILWLLYAGMESGMVVEWYVDDVFNSMAPGLGIGALFKVASVVWSAALAGVAGGNAMGIAAARK